MEFVIVDHVETARDWYEAGGSEHKKTFTDGLRDRSAEYPACAAAHWAVAAANGGDKEVIRPMVESRANVCAPQRSSEDMKYRSGRGVDFFDDRHAEKVCELVGNLGILYAD